MNQFHKQEMISPMAERRIKFLFAAVLVLFPIQYWFARSVTEPYPALLLPSFDGAVVNAAGEVTIEHADVIVTFSDGHQQVLTLRQLFAEAPSSHFQQMAFVALKPKPLGAPPADLWSRSRLTRLIPWQLFPGWVLGKTRRQYWQGVEPATATWMRGRIERLLPRGQAVHVDVAWYTDIFVGGYSGPHQRTPGPVVEVKL